MEKEKKLSEAEKKILAHVKKTFSRELSIRRNNIYEFLRSKRAAHEYNTLANMLEGKKGFSILSLARIADAFGYDVELVRRNDDENND